MQTLLETFLEDSNSEKNKSDLINDINQSLPNFSKTLKDSIKGYLNNTIEKANFIETIHQLNDDLIRYGKNDELKDFSNFEIVFSTIANTYIRELTLDLSCVDNLDNLAKEEIDATKNPDLAYEVLRKHYETWRILCILHTNVEAFLWPLCIQTKNNFFQKIDKLLKDDQKHSLLALRQHLQNFFTWKLWHDYQNTETIVQEIEKINVTLGNPFDVVSIKHLHQEYCLQKAIDSILNHARSYQNKFPDDADKAKQLVQKLKSLTTDFFTQSNFTEEEQKGFLLKLSQDLESNQAILSRHHGWGDAIENIALAISSIFIVGVIPALFKFYKRTIEGDNTFSYFPSKSKILADNVKEAAEKITLSATSISRNM